MGMLELTIYIRCNCIEVYSDIHVILNTVKYNKKYLKKNINAAPVQNLKRLHLYKEALNWWLHKHVNKSNANESLIC